MACHKSLIVVLASLGLAACATVQPQSQQAQAPAPDPETQARVRELQTQVQTLSKRIEDMDSRMAALAEHPITPAKPAVPELKGLPVQAHPADGAGVSVEPITAATDPEAGFVNDAAVRKYRQALILFQAGRYADAILAFSAFVENTPDHPLAGSAQFYVGESYFKQGEFKLAVNEFGRVLTSYDRSPHIAETLRDLAAAEERLKKTEAAARHRQLLTSLFPHSPAAVQEATAPAAANAPAHAPAPAQTPASATPSAPAHEPAAAPVVPPATSPHQEPAPPQAAPGPTHGHDQVPALPTAPLGGDKP